MNPDRSHYRKTPEQKRAAAELLKAWRAQHLARTGREKKASSEPCSPEPERYASDDMEDRA